MHGLPARGTTASSGQSIQSLYLVYKHLREQASRVWKRAVALYHCTPLLFTRKRVAPRGGQATAVPHLDAVPPGPAVGIGGAVLAPRGNPSIQAQVPALDVDNAQAAKRATELPAVAVIYAVSRTQRRGARLGGRRRGDRRGGRRGSRRGRRRRGSRRGRRRDRARGGRGATWRVRRLRPLHSALAHAHSLVHAHCHVLHPQGPSARPIPLPHACRDGPAAGAGEPATAGLSFRPASPGACGAHGKQPPGNCIASQSSGLKVARTASKEREQRRIFVVLEVAGAVLKGCVLEEEGYKFSSRAGGRSYPLQLRCSIAAHRSHRTPRKIGKIAGVAPVTTT
jgi:hypothetical protein